MACMPAKPVAISKDPDRYVCDFTYFASLVAASRSDTADRSWVLFVHLSPDKESYGVDACINMLQDLIRCVAELDRKGLQI